MSTPWPLEGMQIVVVGAARTGRAAARFLASRGVRVTLAEQASEGTFPGLRQGLEPWGVRCLFGPHEAGPFLKADGIVVSPGVPTTLDVLCAARQRGISIVAEMELASWFLAAPMVAVTGTNGKTTTTTLVGKALEASGRRVFVGGNIGNPLIESLGLSPPPEVAVVEVSSFQLEATDRFHPRVAALLNLTEDHLDRHPSMAVYREAKARIFARQGGGDVAVVNLDDPEVLRALPAPPAMEVWGFTLGAGTKAQAAREGDGIRLGVRGGMVRLPIQNPALAGPHGAQNVMAACLCAVAMGCTTEAFQRAAQAYSGLEHRMEQVGEIGGVHFINDSKATNVGAVIPALMGIAGRVVLIAGGKYKGIDFRPLREPVRAKARAVVLLGEAAEPMTEALGGTAPLHRVKDMGAAVPLALGLAKRGDTVLLSPACSSFDQYRDYEERGRDFKAAFGRLAAAVGKG